MVINPETLSSGGSSVAPQAEVFPVESEGSEVVRNYAKYVVPTYAPALVLERGEGTRVIDESGTSYLDFGGGIAVNCLGHAHPTVARAVADQASQLMHVSNLYYHPVQGKLAARLAKLTGPGRMFFSNSGAEANEFLYKAARRYGHEKPGPEGPRYEIITALQSFHGRTLGGISATGQDRVRKGFEPVVPGFVHVPFNDIEAVKEAITPRTAAVLIEGIQGEGGITPAKAEYLLALRELCRERDVLLFFDAVQCGMFRSGCFQSYTAILEQHDAAAARDFLPDGVSMAKSLAGGMPLGATWLREEVAMLFTPGSHGTTYGGNPVVCAAALAVLETIENEGLVANIRKQSQRLMGELSAFAKSGEARTLRGMRGMGLLLGLVVDKPAAEIVTALRLRGLLTVPAGTEVVRLLPPYNVTDAEVEEALGILREIL